MPLIQTLGHASSLGRWTFSECRPAALATLIESIWEVEGTVAHTRERIFPNGRVDLLVNLGPPQRLVEGDGAELFDTACVSGFQYRPLVIESMPRTHIFGVRLRPEGAYALFAAPMRAISGRVVDLRELLGAAGRDISGRIVAAPSFEERVLLICRWAEERSACARRAEPYVAWITSEIEATGGGAAIGHLCRAAGVSRKKLVADFRQHVGVTPKLLARVVRFRRVLAMLQHGNGSLTDVALAAGYYDHSHMNVDFREFAGLAPREFLATRYPDGNSAVAI